LAVHLSQRLLCYNNHHEGLALTDRLTPHSEKVLKLLRHAKKPLTAYEILDQLRDDGFRAPPTVYRALENLTKHGLAHRIESLGAFVACPSDDPCHEHHGPIVLCTGCGSVEEVEDKSLEAALEKVGHKYLKKVDREVLEISGLCRECADKIRKN
jgi:Fur family zinc uptake transcriptional regulator